MTRPLSFTKSTILSGVLLVLLSLTAQAQPNYPRDPAEAKVIYSDLVNFEEAYAELASNTDTLQVLQELYFDRASVGLNEFISRHGLTPELLQKAISTEPERYALLPGFLANIDEVEEEHQALMQAFDKAIPNAMYPPTYLLVGANRGIGQASQVGQLITVIRPIDSTEKLNELMAHELSHFQQAVAMGGPKYQALYASPDNMLGLCLREGGAEFMASLVVKNITQKASLAYLEEDEARLKKQFLSDLESQNKEFWLWDSLEKNKHPGLLGYAIGYKICKQFYELAPDKNEALKDILKMEDAEAFLESSGYFKN